MHSTDIHAVMALFPSDWAQSWLRRGGAWTEAQLVAVFQGATRGVVVGELKRLAGLGRVVSWEAKGARWWPWG